MACVVGTDDGSMRAGSPYPKWPSQQPRPSTAARHGDAPLAGFDMPLVSALTSSAFRPRIAPAREAAL